MNITHTVTYTPEQQNSDAEWSKVCEQAYGIAREHTSDPATISTVQPYDGRLWIVGYDRADGSRGVVAVQPA